MNVLDKHTKFKMKFNSIVENLSDPTLLDANIIIHDFDVSENGQCITKEVCEENMASLVGKRITCQYINADNNKGLDALGDHGEYIGLDRKGNEQIYTNSIAIGFIKEVYIGESEGKECLMGKCTLWRDDKYKDITDLLLEWNSKGIRISMSCEYLYLNYEVKDGIEYIKSPIIYTAHTLLNSEERGYIGIVEPAYSIATMSFNDIKSWNNALNSLNKKLNNKEDDKMTNAIFEMLKSSNAISAGDLEWKLWDAFGNILTHNEYATMWLSKYNIYTEERYVIVELYSNDKYSMWKVGYSIGEDEVVSVDWEGRIEVEYAFDLKEVKTSLNTKTKKVEELSIELENIKTSLNTKILEVETITKDKNEVTNKLNDTNEMVISLNSKIVDLNGTIESLNSKIEEMKPIVEAHELAEYEKELNSLKEIYEDKFKKVNALDVYELESTQDLIKQCVNAKDKEYLSQLNQLIVDNVRSTIKIDEDPESVKSINSIITPKKQEKVEFANIYKEMCGIEI